MSVPLWYDVVGFEPIGVHFYFNPDNMVPALLLTLLGSSFTVGYFVWWFVLLGKGQTPGKYLMKIRAVDAETGETPKLRKMFVREFLLKCILFNPNSGIRFIVGLYWLARLDENMGWDVIVVLYNLFFRQDGLVIFAVFFLPYWIFLIDSLWALYGTTNQTIHDKMVGTRMMRISPST